MFFRIIRYLDFTVPVCLVLWAMTTSLFTQIVMDDGNLMDYEVKPSTTPMFARKNTTLSAGTAIPSPQQKGFSVIHDVARPRSSFTITPVNAAQMAQPVETCPTTERLVYI